MVGVMDFRLAMLDIDGTLRHKGDWFPGAVDLVHHLASSGLDVALCSGRTTGSMFTLAAELPEDLPGTFPEHVRHEYREVLATIRFRREVDEELSRHTQGAPR